MYPRDVCAIQESAGAGAVVRLVAENNDLMKALHHPSLSKHYVIAQFDEYRSCTLCSFEELTTQMLHRLKLL
jgi:hypothetical protein